MKTETFEEIRTDYFERMGDNVAAHMREAVKCIDAEFGDGFARDNPSLLGAFIQAAVAHESAQVSSAIKNPVRRFPGHIEGAYYERHTEFKKTVSASCTEAEAEAAQSEKGTVTTLP